MLSKGDVQFGRGRPVAPDTFIRGSDPKARHAMLCARSRSRTAAKRLLKNIDTAAAQTSRPPSALAGKAYVCLLRALRPSRPLR